MHPTPSARFIPTLAASLCLLLASCATPSTPPKASNDKEVEVLFRAPVHYPSGLVIANLTGEALVEFTVTPDGNVINPVVIEATHPLFGEAAIESIQQWKFKPGLKDGVPVYCRVQERIAFNLPPDSPAPPTKSQTN